MSDLEHTYTPAEAADIYGFAPSLLRRYAAIYESLGGTIAQDKRGGRIYTAELLKHFSAARDRVKTGEKVGDALRTLDLAPAESVRGADSSLDAQRALELFERALSVNEGLQHDVAGLREQVAELQEQVTELAQRRLAPDHETELERTNRYLLGELERRRLEADQQAQRRPWWQWWGQS